MMKNLKNSGIALLILLIGINACAGDKTRSTEEGSKDTTVADSLPISNEEIVSPDSASISDSSFVGKIRAALPGILEKQLVGIDPKDRQFSYFLTDLNADGKNEQFVWFKGMNWCGSGGCTALLLSDEQKLITYFTVIDFPVTISEDKTDGWKNLIVYSGRANRLLKWSGKGYPKNPSVAPKYSGKEGDGKTFAAMPEKWFTF